MPPDTDSPRSRALDYIANERFHRHFTLPATTSHAELTVSFADVGCLPDQTSSNTQPRVILFMPGMFASRCIGIPMHPMAERLGLRILVVDRPGMGHSTQVPLDQRVSVWVELVPRLLQHLGISHVSLLSHSAGTIFLLNTLYHCRDVLHPQNGFAALLAPWVDPAHSHVTSMQMAQFLPNPAFGLWHHIPRFFVTKAGPLIAFSSASLITTSAFISSSAGGTGAEGISVQERNRQRMEREYGVPRDFQAELASQVMKSMFNENTIGANSEAMQCLRKEPSWSWGICGDYEEFVKKLSSLERSRKQRDDNDTDSPQLRVRILFAEDDSMIGKGGQAYMEQCWKKDLEDTQDCLDVATITVAGTNHDSLVESVEALESVFIDAAGLRR